MGRRGLIAALACLAVAGCGATPPQAPGPEAYRLNNALSAVSTACGNAYEIEAFSHRQRDLAAAERQAARALPVLARIYKRNPAWIFQGKSVSELVVMTNTYLDECGLHTAARRLRGLTSG